MRSFYLTPTRHIRRFNFNATRKILLRVSLALLLQQVFVLSALSDTPHPTALVLHKALVINSPSPLEPSGLAYCQGHLLMIADNEDHLIFELRPEADESQLLHVYKTLNSPLPPAPLPELPWFLQLKHNIAALTSQKEYDWEAITCDEQGNLWLASERYIALAKVTADGTLSWLALDIYTRGKTRGLFQVNNGYLEGLAWHPSQRLFMVAERQQRGILVTTLKENSPAELQTIKTIAASPLSGQASRSVDFSDVWVEPDALYTLERNHYAVCRRSLSTLDAESCWSYAAVENSADYRYADSEFGIAEGLARVGNKLYIVVDNNQKNSLKTGQNHAMLFIYEVPDNWQSSQYHGKTP
jgi:hypothetical protein